MDPVWMDYVAGGVFLVATAVIIGCWRIDVWQRERDHKALLAAKEAEVAQRYEAMLDVIVAAWRDRRECRAARLQWRCQETVDRSAAADGRFVCMMDELERRAGPPADSGVRLVALGGKKVVNG